MNSTFEMHHFTDRERRIIARLARHFYITRAADIAQVGNSAYRSFLMRPAEDVSIVLNVEREIVVLFADYVTFEARTLRAFDLTYDQFDDVRVDRSLRFLISADKDIGHCIKLYLQQNPEYPIVVPFHFDEFLNITEDFFFNSIRKNYLTRDLFGYQSPLKYEYYFFGRAKLVEAVIDSHKSGQNSGLFGLRKSGKTSTIYAIQRRAKSSGCRTLLIDCQDPAVHAKRYSALIEYLVVQTRSQMSLRKVDTSVGTAPDEVSENFNRLMTQTLGDMQSDLLIIFDEIENISPQTSASPHWREGSDTLLLWQTLRSFFQKIRKFKLTFSFVGTNPHLFEASKIGDVDNPVYLFAPKTFIPMLAVDESHEMITRLGYFMGLDFDRNVTSHIHSRFGGHPFFIRQLCSHVHKNAAQQRPVTVSIAACIKAERDSNSDIKDYLSDILISLREFYPDEYSMIEYLAMGDHVTFSNLARYSPSYVEHLIGYGIIVRRGEDFEFAFDAVAEAVKESFNSQRDLSLEEKRVNISLRRNKIEEELRSLLYRAVLGQSEEIWMETLAKCLTANRRTQVGYKSRREAFSKLKSPFYLSELIKFVQITKVLNAFDVPVSEITSALDRLNKHRIDAHAGDITAADYLELTRSIEILEGAILPP